MTKAQYNCQLRQKVRVTKALNTEYTFKDFAEMSDMKYGSFKNWLSGAYELSMKRLRIIDGIMNDLGD